MKNKIIKKLWSKTKDIKRVIIAKDIKTIHDKKQFARIIELERDRVHRGNKQFTVVVFAINHEINGKMNTKKIIYKISKRIRQIDQIGWYDKNHIGILLPNTNKKGAEIIKKEIIQAVGNIENKYDIKIISYPE